MAAPSFVRVLLVVSALVMLAFVAFVSVPRAPGPHSYGAPLPQAPAAAPTPWVQALDFLPRDHVRDGTLDYTAYLQAALDAAGGGVLVLPPFPLRVSRVGDTGRCLIVRRPIEIRGAPGSQLVETQGGVTLLRVEGARGVRLTGFALAGRGGRGTGLAHGLLHVADCEDVVVEDVTALDADADGIAIVDARRVAVRGARAARASRHGILLRACQGAVVADCTVEGGTGHLGTDGSTFGAGIRAASCADVAITGNVVRDGLGAGIVVDAEPGGASPTGCSVVANRVTGWRNATNPARSSGVLLGNAGQSRSTRTLVSANVIEDCGDNGLRVEGQDGVSLLGNTVGPADRSAIYLGDARDAAVVGNVVRGPDASRSGNQAGLHLGAGSTGVVARGNRIEARVAAPHAPAWREEPGAAGNSLEPQELRAATPPSSGLWSRGDVVWNSEPWPGAPLGWVCTSAGEPGLWSVLSRIE
ncbi:MAG: right-handed parallel beta-helix repeat-containing protein [Planctomycetes bacterium]|nr:right-handed parallel beta-helix repeat-containing protein [Planctomycetota bacterium]